MMIAIVIGTCPTTTPMSRRGKPSEESNAHLVQ
jgi:hypothetical protein